MTDTLAAALAAFQAEMPTVAKSHRASVPTTYLLGALTGVVTDDDDDGRQAQVAAKRQQPGDLEAYARILSTKEEQ